MTAKTTIRMPQAAREAYWAVKMQAEKARAAHEAAARELQTYRIMEARRIELEKMISTVALALGVPDRWDFDREAATFRDSGNRD